MDKEKILIGRSDKVDLPDFELNNISAKIDTGAYTCSIHCQKYELKNDNKLHFTLAFPLQKEGTEKEFITEDFSVRDIKSSSGIAEKRFIIKTKIILFEQEFNTEFSLSDRSTMKHPILLGRKLLKNRFLVDVTKFNLSYKNKRKNKKKN